MNEFDSNEKCPIWCVVAGCLGSILFMQYKINSIAAPPSVAEACVVMAYVLGIFTTALLMGRRIGMVLCDDPGAGPGADLLIGWGVFWAWIWFTKMFPPTGISISDDGEVAKTYEFIVWICEVYIYVTSIAGFSGYTGLLIGVGLLAVIGLFVLNE